MNTRGQIEGGREGEKGEIEEKSWKSSGSIKRNKYREIERERENLEEKARDIVAQVAVREIKEEGKEIGRERNVKKVRKS